MSTNDADQNRWSARIFPLPDGMSPRGPGMVRYNDPAEDPDAWFMNCVRFDGDDWYMYLIGQDEKKYRFPWRTAARVPEGFYLLAEECPKSDALGVGQ